MTTLRLLIHSTEMLYLYLVNIRHKFIGFFYKILIVVIIYNVHTLVLNGMTDSPSIPRHYLTEFILENKK